MSAFLSSLAFLNPWVLATLIVLPVLWFLLRVTPPAPKQMVFPATRFLADLIPEAQTPSKTPWWLLLLRCLIVALIILALARPVLHPAESLPTRDHIRLVIDNSWAAASLWPQQMQLAEELASRAGRENRDIYILTTAAEPGATDSFQAGPVSEGQALSILRGLKPHPWPANFTDASKFLKDNPPSTSLYSFWLGHGLDESGFNILSKTLQTQGGLTYITPPSEQLPLILRAPEKVQSILAADIDALSSIPPGLPAIVQVTAEDGRILDRTTIALDPQSLPASVTFDLPESLKETAARIELAGTQKNTGGIILIDERFKRRMVGIISASESTDTTPLSEAEYYLKRALEPYTEVRSGTVEDILENEPSMLILPDIGAMPTSTLESLEDWVKSGGLLLRFAGPTMAQSDPFLVPVPLRKGQRVLGGQLSWDEPQKLMPFTKESPLYGITLSDDIIIREQILPEGSTENKVWAALEDGTPLITASALEDGLLVLVHTTADPEWSDLALSGTYVEILRRMVSLSSSPGAKTAYSGNLQPLAVLDGFGTLIDPKGVKAIPADDFQDMVPNSFTPPGLYGLKSYNRAFNLGERLGPLKAAGAVPLGASKQIYGNTYETDLMPLLLAAALGALMLDWLIMIVMSLHWPRLRPIHAALLAFALIVSTPSFAQSSAEDVTRAGSLHLAYIKSGDASVDQTTHQGLENLSTVLRHRTSVEPEGAVAIDPEQDNLAFYPLIYWPVIQTPKPLSDDALKAIQSYLDHGGTILFDTRDQSYSANALGGFATTANAKALREMIGSLNIPPLSPIPDDHVLTKSFYLLRDFPGRYNGGTLWVEENSASGRDGVSSIIIGGNDWGAAWAAQQSGGSLRPHLTGGPQQQEMAYRFGVNVMMYALTGNYKADQVHLPHILERLGQ